MSNTTTISPQYSAQPNAYIFVNQQGKGANIPYSSIEDYYMLINDTFNVLGSTLYYSDADYYLITTNDWIPQLTGAQQVLVPYTITKNAYFGNDNIVISVSEQKQSEYKSGIIDSPEKNFYIGAKSTPVGGAQIEYPVNTGKASSDKDNYDYIAKASAAAKYAKNILFPTLGGDGIFDLMSTGFVEFNYLLQGVVPFVRIPISKRVPYIAALGLLEAMKEITKPVGKREWVSAIQSNGSDYFMPYNLRNQKLTTIPQYAKNDVVISETTPDILERQKMGNLYSRLQSSKDAGSPATSSTSGQSYKYYLSANKPSFDYDAYTSYTTESKAVTASAFKLWRSVYIPDPVHAHIPTNKIGIVSSSYKNDPAYRQGMKFRIEDVLGQRIMMTPAFLTGLSEEGGNAVWQQFNYVGSPYANFLYQGTDPRRIMFTLQLTCFSQDTLPQYVDKLNFLRGLGFPRFKSGQMTKYYGDNGVAVKTDQSIEFPQASLYKLTLGDIVAQQSGFFESTQLTWDDEANFWNFNALLDKSLDGMTASIELPMVTTVQCTFVCLYGRSPDNKHEFYKPYMQNNYVDSDPFLLT